MFGKEISDSSNITVQIKLRIGAGHPLLAWSGAPKTPDNQVIEDICRNAVVSKYLYKAIQKGKLKSDDMGSCVVPAYLCILEDEEQIEEKKIEIVINLVSSEAEQENQSLVFDKMFSIYAQTMERLAASHSLQVVEAQKTLGTTAAQSAKIIEASAHPMTVSLGLIEKAYVHESSRADSAADAVIRMLNNKDTNKTDWVDDAVKLIGASPILLAAFEKAIEAFKKGAK